MAARSRAPRAGAACGVVVVDDREITRVGVCAVLDTAAGVQVIHSGASIAEALEVAADPRVAVVVLSLDLPDTTPGMSVGRFLRRAPSVRVLGMTARPDPMLRRQTLSAGAVGYLTTEAPARDLVDAVHGSRIAAIPAQQVPLAPSADGLVTLRELEVLQLMARAYSNRSIAGALSIAEGTVKRHTNNLYRKMRVGSRIHAITEGRRLGLLA